MDVGEWYPGCSVTNHGYSVSDRHERSGEWGTFHDSHGGLLFGFDARTGGECFGSRGFHCRAVTKGVG